MLIIGLSGAIGSGKSVFSEVASSVFHAEVISMRNVYSARKPLTRLDQASRYLPSTTELSPGDLRDRTARIRSEIDEHLKTVVDRWSSRRPEVVVFEDLTTQLERQCLESLAKDQNARLVFIAIESPSNPKLRYRRYVANQEFNEEAFKECENIERVGSDVSGREPTLSKDWAPNIESLRLLSDQTINNGEHVSLKQFQVACEILIDQIGTKAGKSYSRDNGEFLSRTAYPPDSVAQVRRLETRKRAADFVNARFTQSFKSLDGLVDDPLVKALSPLSGPTHLVDEITNQFMVRLLDAFLVKPAREALQQFRMLEFSTSDEEAVVLTNDTEFIRIYDELWAHLTSSEVEVERYARSEFPKVLKKLDGEQLTRRGVRTGPSLDEVRLNGLQLEPIPGAMHKIEEAQAYVGSRRLPILEVLKNEKILNLNDLSYSKVSHAVHDALDHIWFFDLLSRKEILQRHSIYFRGIENPELHDMFCRESESVASISFGVRLWANQQIGFVPNTSLSEIRLRLEDAFREQKLEEHHLHAFRRVLYLSSNVQTREAQSLAFVWSNYLVELDEQRRKHGEIKYFRNGARSMPLDPWDPDYLCFFIDAHHELCDPKNKHRDNLLRVHMAIEEYLCSEDAISGKRFVLRVPRLHERSVWDPQKTTLPSSRIEWMARHFGFTALREPADI